jgi:hypothetical protein
MIYYDNCHMSSEIIQSVCYVNCNDFFNISTSRFHKISGLFNEEIDPRVMYLLFFQPDPLN